jgi:uroporphyrinogen-III decarboxylase
VKVIAGSGIRCLFVEECLSSSDLISEADYLKFCYPFTRDLLQFAREAGLHIVYYFCGGIRGRLEHLAALPAHALAFEESKKGFLIDLGEVRRAVGPERPLLGNLAATLLRDGAAEQITRAVAEQYREAGPLLAMSCGSPVTLDTPPEKVDMLVEATGGAGIQAKVSVRGARKLGGRGTLSL